MIRNCKHHGETRFRKNQEKSGKITYHCVECYTERQKRLRQQKKEVAIEYKGGKCSICGYDKCNAALDFHHVDPTQKEVSVDYRAWSFDRLKEELDKCILVCANCHRELHFNLNNVAL